MNAKDFRIGNFLKDEVTGSILKINELSDKGYGFKVVEWLKEVNGEIKRSEIKPAPIPLTNELFMKNGFVKDNETYSWSKLFNFDEYDYLFELECFPNDGAFYFERKCGQIKYVHQLQNLYFVLTVQEIEISL